MNSNKEFRIAKQEGRPRNEYMTGLSFYRLSVLSLQRPLLLLFHVGSIAALAPSPLQKMEELSLRRIMLSCGAGGEAGEQGNFPP